jgi:septal ring factor EnvC (AmiA/AmiB activator)
MTTSNDRRTPRRRGNRWRLLQLFLGVAMLAPSFLLAAPSAPVRADALSDAIKEQQRLAKLIANQKSQLVQLSNQQASLRSQITKTQADLAGVRTTIDQAQADVDALGSQGVKASYDSLASEQVLFELRLVQLTNIQNAKQRELDVRESILAGRLAAAYETDQTPLLQQILTAHSLTDALADVSYYGDLAAADKALADQIRTDQAALAEMRQNVQTASDANSQLKNQVGSQKQQIVDQQSQLAAAQRQLTDLKAQLETQLAAQQAAETKLEANQTTLNAAIRSNGQALDSRLHRRPVRASCRELCPLPPGHRHCRSVLDAGLRGRRRRGGIRGLQPL